MGPLCSGEKRNNRARWISARGQDDLDREALISQELHASPTMPSAERVSPQQGSRSDRERKQEHTHLTRLRGCIAQPLTLLAQGAGTANYGYWQRRPHASSHRLPDAARERSASARRDSTTCHLAERQSRDPRSDPPSRSWRPRRVHSPAQAKPGR